MAIEPKILEILACPKCKGPVKQDSAQGGLVCESCRLRYPVRNGIPVMLSDEAEKI